MLLFPRGETCDHGGYATGQFRLNDPKDEVAIARWNSKHSQPHCAFLPGEQIRVRHQSANSSTLDIECRRSYPAPDRSDTDWLVRLRPRPDPGSAAKPVPAPAPRAHRRD